jgi:hypothetical protein
MARKKQNIDSENIEKKEYEEEEEEYIQVEAEQEKEEEEEAGEEEIQGDILFFVKSSIVYTENQYKSLFGKPKFTN